ncbi:MAG: hypothetical protein ACRD22_18755 [Terriglobia bacterium]
MQEQHSLAMPQLGGQRAELDLRVAIFRQKRLPSRVSIRGYWRREGYKWDTVEWASSSLPLSKEVYDEIVVFLEAVLLSWSIDKGGGLQGSLLSHEDTDIF